MNRSDYIDRLLDEADRMAYSDFCRVMLVVWWNM